MEILSENDNEKEIFSFFEKLYLFLLAIICLNDYISAFWEIRKARNIVPSVWVIRIFNVPIAEVVVIIFFSLLIFRIFLRTKWRIKINAIDFFVVILFFIALYGAVIGLSTFTGNDKFEEFLYSVRLYIDFIFTYCTIRIILTSRTKVLSTWKSFFNFGLFFVSINITTWCILYFGFGFHPIGALGLGPIVLSDVGNSFLLAFYAIIGIILIATKSNERNFKIRIWILSVVSLILLIISMRRGQIAGIIIVFFIFMMYTKNKNFIKKGIQFFFVVLFFVPFLSMTSSTVVLPYINSVFTLFDSKTASTEIRLTGNKNILANLNQNELWLTGLGLGRRYEYIIESPNAENLSAYSESELGERWRFSVQGSNPFLISWLRYGIIIGTFSVLIYWAMLIYLYQLYYNRLKNYLKFHRILILVSLLCVFSPLAIIGMADPKNSIIFGFILALTSASLNLLAPKDYDNLKS